MVVANAALAQSLLAFLYVALRLIRIADGDTETALALLGHVNLLEAVLSLIVGQSPPVSFFIAALAVVVWMNRLERRQRPLWLPAIVLVVLSILWMLVVAPHGLSLIVRLLVLLGLVVLLVLLVVGSEAGFSAGRFSLLDRPRPLTGAEIAWRRRWETVLLTLWMFLVITAGGNPDYWAERETVVLTDKSVLTGWVLGEEGIWTSILRDRPREVVHVRTDQIAERRICVSRYETPSAGSRATRCAASPTLAPAAGPRLHRVHLSSDP